MFRLNMLGLKIRLHSFLCLLGLLAYSVNAFSQDFEGIVTKRTITKDLDHETNVYIKGSKSMTELQVNETSSIRVLKDSSNDSFVLLKQVDSLRYGMRSTSAHSEPEDYSDFDPEPLGIEIEATQSIEEVRGHLCQKYFINSKAAQSEVWVAEDINFRLSTYFPEFTGGGSSQLLIDHRKAADALGFVMNYWETNADSKEEFELNMTVKNVAVPDDKINIDPSFKVFTKSDVESLYKAAQHDELKKKEWEEFMQLFQNN